MTAQPWAEQAREIVKAAWTNSGYGSAPKLERNVQCAVETALQAAYRRGIEEARKDAPFACPEHIAQLGPHLRLAIMSGEKCLFCKAGVAIRQLGGSDV